MRLDEIIQHIRTSNKISEIAQRAYETMAQYAKVSLGENMPDWNTDAHQREIHLFLATLIWWSDEIDQEELITNVFLDSCQKMNGTLEVLTPRTKPIQI